MSETMHFTVGGILEEMARRFPANDALVYPDRDIRYSYQQFDTMCDRVAKGLLAMGIEKGDNLAIWATNVPEWVIVQFASAKIGAVLVTVNTSYKSSELDYVLKQSDSKMLFLVDGFKDTNYVDTVYDVATELRECDGSELNCAALPCLKNVMYIGDETPTGMSNFNAIEALGEEISDEEYDKVRASLREDDVINMQYTSGTTGFPKGVMLTHHNIVNNGYNIGECMRFTE
ncbi:MAG: AMP-binding protein, partial [Desulfobacteraceae bacterium 4572_35.2]